MDITKRIGIAHLLPDTAIQASDAALTLCATEMAVNHFYAPGTTSRKVFSYSPFTGSENKDPKKFHLLKWL